MATYSFDSEYDTMMKRKLSTAYEQIELKESLVARTPLEGAVAVEAQNTHMGTFHAAPFEVKQPMDHMNILLENGLTVFDNPQYDDATKVHVLKGIFEELVKDHATIYKAISEKK